MTLAQFTPISTTTPCRNVHCGFAFSLEETFPSSLSFFIFSPSHLPSVFFPQSLLLAFVSIYSLEPLSCWEGLVMNRQGSGWSRIHKSNHTGESEGLPWKDFPKKACVCGEEPGLPLPPPCLLVFAMAVGRSERR